VEAGIEPAEIATISKQDAKALGAVAVTRERTVRLTPDSWEETRIFRGSGAIVVANSDEILAYSYAPGPDGVDPVADHHGPDYQFAALRKAGRASYGHAVRLPSRPFTLAYRMLDADLIDESLNMTSQPHHLGYAWSRDRNDGTEYSVGASGMLASDGVAARRRDIYARQLDEDYELDWVNWPGDEFAGYDDAQAAASVANRMTGGDGYPNVPTIPMLHATGVNLH
jgi:hypothetical protein